MILAPSASSMFMSLAKFSKGFYKTEYMPPNFVFYSSILSDDFSAKASFRCFCTKKEDSDNVSEGFCVLSTDIPWDSESIWSTMALYFFSLHIPLSFGGLSVISQIRHQPVLDPQTEATSLLIIQSLELLGSLMLLRYIAKSKYDPVSFFYCSNLSKERNWVQASMLGFGFLILLVLHTSLLADRVLGPKAVNNPILKEILSSGFNSKTACFLTYCLITPLLEEIVYRGFLLRSLASRMNWQQAIVLSSCIFSAAHLSTENSLQLFIIGCVLGCSYCWTGNLSSSFAVHSLYNAVIIMITIFS